MQRLLDFIPNPFKTATTTCAPNDYRCQQLLRPSTWESVKDFFTGKTFISGSYPEVSVRREVRERVGGLTPEEEEEYIIHLRRGYHPSEFVSPVKAMGEQYSSLKNRMGSVYEHAKENVGEAYEKLKGTAAYTAERAKGRAEDVWEGAERGYEKAKGRAREVTRKGLYGEPSYGYGRGYGYGYERERSPYAYEQRRGIFGGREPVMYERERPSYYYPSEQVGAYLGGGVPAYYTVPVTAMYGAAMGLYYVVLLLRVWVQRRKAKVYLGDGSVELVQDLLKKDERGTTSTKSTETVSTRYLPLRQSVMRLTAFSNYVPFAIGLLGFLEYSNFPRWALHLLFLATLVTRVMASEAIGSDKEVTRARQVGVYATMGVIGAASLASLYYSVVA